MFKTNIYPINPYKPAFKSKEYQDDGVLGFSDSESQKTRDTIREWHDAYYMPYSSIYEKECNLSEYKMKQLLATLMGKPKKVDYSMVTGIDAYNVRTLNRDGSCYRGSTLLNKPEALKTIKKAGIERVIDLAGYYGYEKDVHDAGLEYYSPEFRGGALGVWDEEAFQTKEQMLARESRGYSPEDLEKRKQYLNIKANSFDRHIRSSVDRFVNYIETMQKGYYYIGCEFGTYTTDNYLLLNSVFNPKAPDRPLRCSDLFKIDFMRNLYTNLTPKDKVRMGWTKEFDENVPKRLDKAELNILESQKDRTGFLDLY